MKMAVIDPHPQWGTGSTRGYHLVLAQKLLSDAPYREWYRCNASRGMFVIVDNGAAESDTPPFEEVVRVANYIHADEVVLPDAVCDGEATLKLLAAVPAWVWDDLAVPRRFVVPQGTNYEEWLYSFTKIHREYHFSTIGVSKYFPLDRFQLLNIYFRRAKLNGAEFDYNVHVLGLVGNPLTEIRRLVTEYPWVRGFDTGAPFAWAQAGEFISEARNGKRYSLSWDAAYKGITAQLNIDALQTIIHEELTRG